MGIPILLQITGVIVIIAEFILPSGGILSILAALLFGYSLYIVFDTLSAGTGMVFLAADVILIPILVIVGLKLLAFSPFALRKRLTKESGVVSQDPATERFMGKSGKTSTDLRPSGMANIDGEKIDVVSRGEYIDKGSEIVVIEVSGNQVIVRLINE